MENSIFTTAVCEEFNRLFPDGWINAYNWGDKKNNKVFYAEGKTKIEEFRSICFVNFAKLILSGDFFLTNADTQLQELDSATLFDVTYNSNKAQNSLSDLFQRMLFDLHDSVYLVSHHIQCTKRRFEQKHFDELFSAVQYKRQRDVRHELVDLLGFISKACQIEFELTYSVDLINQILLLRESLNQFNFSKEINDIRDAAVVKLELLLYKLSHFSKNQKIQYNYNLKHVDLQPLCGDEGKVIEYKDLFIAYLDVETWSQDKTNEYIVNPDAESIELWKAVMLMRYYTKKTKNINQIDNLLKLTEKHYAQSIVDDSGNAVNLYADKTSRNYFYNSRFSFLCSKGQDYKYEDMKRDLTQIEQIQNDTFVFNYHPYQKAFVYLQNLINREITQGKTEEEIKPHLEFLEYCFKKFKETVEWCKVNQPYLLQLRFNFSVIDDTKRGLKVFYPSSFLRPLRFDHLKETLIDFQNRISVIKYSVENQSQRIELLEAKSKVDNMEKDSYKLMGFFSTIVIFLVGTITIFTGNNSDVSVFSKMEYVFVLGAILLLFVSLGYLAMAKMNGRIKHWIFGIVTGVLITLLVSYFLNRHRTSEDTVNEPTEQTNPIDVEPQTLIIQQGK